MTDAATVNAQAPSTTQPTRRPPAIPLPKAIQAVAFLGFRRWTVQTALKRYGPLFVLNVPFYSRMVVVSEPALVRQVFTAIRDTQCEIGALPEYCPRF